CIKRTGEIFGASHIIDVLRGSRSQRVLSRNHDKLTTYDIGNEYAKQEWQQISRQLLEQAIIVRDTQHGSLKLTSKAYDIFKGQQFMGIDPGARSASPSPRRSAAVDQDYDAELFELLR